MSCVWARYLDEKSLLIMLWSVGELCVRCFDISIAELKKCNRRALGGFWCLYLLGKQGRMDGEQEFQVIARNNYNEQPRALGEASVSGLSGLQALITDTLLLDVKMGKYSKWWKGDIETLVTTIWCIGGLIAEPIGEELTPKQKHYMDIISLLYWPRGKNIKEFTQQAIKDFGV